MKICAYSNGQTEKLSGMLEGLIPDELTREPSEADVLVCLTEEDLEKAVSNFPKRGYILYGRSKRNLARLPESCRPATAEEIISISHMKNLGQFRENCSLHRRN